MLVEHLLQGLGEIAEEVKPIGDLRGGGGPLPCPVGIGGRAIARDHLDPRMLPKPLCQGLGRTIREQRHRLPALQIDPHRPLGLAFPQGEIVPPKHRRGGECRHRVSASLAQQGGPAHRDVPGVAQTHAGPAPERQTEGHEALDEPQCTPGPGRGHSGQPFGEDPAWAGSVLAKPLAHPQLQAHAVMGPGQIGQRALVAAMET